MRRFLAINLLLLMVFLSSCKTTGAKKGETENPGQPVVITAGETRIPQTGGSYPSPVTGGENDTLIECVYKSSSDLEQSIPQGTVMAVIKISSQDEFEAEFAEEMLIFVLVQTGRFRIVERKDIDVIKQEQNFQLSGDVDDDTAVSIGKMAGASIVITGSIIPYGTGKYLGLRALDVETSQIHAASSRQFKPF